MLGTSDANNLDQYIEILMQCKPLKENEVKLVCEKVILIFII